MKVIHLHAKSTVDIKLTESAVNALPKKIGLVTTIQHLYKLDEVVLQLKEAVKGGQVLGCNAEAAEKIADKVDAFLFIGTGEFHPIAVALKTGKPVYKWNPFAKKLSVVEDKEIERLRKRKQAALVKFLSSDRIGILVSVKHGQNKMEKAVELSKKKDKEYYIFALTH